MAYANRHLCWLIQSLQPKRMLSTAEATCWAIHRRTETQWGTVLPWPCPSLSSTSVGEASCLSELPRIYRLLREGRQGHPQLSLLRAALASPHLPTHLCFPFGPLQLRKGCHPPASEKAARKDRGGEDTDPAETIKIKSPVNLQVERACHRASAASMKCSLVHPRAGQRQALLRGLL